MRYDNKKRTDPFSVAYVGDLIEKFQTDVKLRLKEQLGR